jgi:dihydroneopterin aldolase
MFAHPLFSHPPAGAGELRTLYVHDLVCDAAIGVHHAEKGRTQKILVSLAVQVEYPDRPLADELASVLDYGVLHGAIRDLACSRHIHLQETLAEQIAEFCLTLPEVRAVYVRIGKLEAFDDCRAVGCELLRRRGP